MDSRNLPGSLKVAILIQAMGEGAAQTVLNSLTDSERQMIMGHMSQLGMISPDVVEKVAEEFTALASRGGARPAKKAIVPEKEKYEGEQSAGSASAGLRSLQSMDAGQLVSLIKDEHPQTIAIILVNVKTDVASAVLAELSDEVKTDVALRIAGLDKVVSGMLEEIDRVFEDALRNKAASLSQDSGGVGRLAEILNQMQGQVGEEILNEIEDIDPELAAAVKQRMFVFEDLVLVDDQGLQKVLRGVETKELAMALKATSDEVRAKVFRNMSSRASEMLKDEIDSLGAVRMKQVEDAQQTITKIIQTMEAKGEVIISGRRGEELIA